MPDPFITTTDIISYTGRSTPAGTAEPALIMAADAACDIIRDYTGQQFNRGTTTTSLDGTGTDALVMPQMPVNTIDAVTVNGEPITDYVVADNGCLFRGTTGVLSTSLYWPAGRQNITVTYDHGYDDADIPRSIRRIALEVAARTVIQGPMIEEYVGPVRARYAAASTELTPTERLILDTYRRRS